MKETWIETDEPYIGLIYVRAHCDSRILHEPGLCKYCDMYPEAQAKRIELGVNFTGGKNDLLKSCPAEKERGMVSIHGWGGNQPHGPGVSEDFKEALKKIERFPSKVMYGKDHLDRF